MAEQNQNNQEDVIEVPVTEQVEQEQAPNNEDIIDLQDVGYMVVIGRSKEGETFFRTVGVDDLLLIDGLVDYAKHKVEDAFQDHFEAEKRKQAEQEG